MSEPTNLVPNLKKIMEEYTEMEEETIQATQAETGQEEERAKVKANSHWKNKEKGRKELKKREQKAVEKKQATGSQSRLMLLRGIYSTETS